MFKSIAGTLIALKLAKLGDVSWQLVTLGVLVGVIVHIFIVGKNK